MHKLFALMLLAFGSCTASACSCAVRTVDDLVRSAGTIYIATLLEATSIPQNSQNQWASVEGKFRIDKVLKGQVSGEFATLVTADAGASCGVFMIVPAKYLVFDNALVSCSGTTNIAPFDEEDISKKIIAAVALSARPKKPNEVAPQTAK